jgi:hypothetical protein
MKVSVKWSRQVFENLELDPLLTVAVFKLLLYKLTGVEPARQRIMVKGTVVKDEQDWSSYKKLQPGMTLVLMGSALKIILLPERWSVLQHAWDQHALQGELTPLQASLLRLAVSGLIHERLGKDTHSAWVADDCDILVRIAQMVVGSAKRVRPPGAHCQLLETNLVCIFSWGLLILSTSQLPYNNCCFPGSLPTQVRR